VKERQHDNPKPPEEVRDRIWELAEKIDVCMFTTWDGQEQQSRPLSARVRKDEHAVYFLVDESGEKNAQLEQYPAVSCVWADNGNYKYALIAGKAELSNNRAKIAQLWIKADEAWWNGVNDPTIRLLAVAPERGELWDSPGKAAALVKMAAAIVTGAAPEMGDNAKVEF
jgi:general stress protein 26